MERKDAKKLVVEEIEKRVAPMVSSLDPNGDGLTGKLKPRDR